MEGCGCPTQGAGYRTQGARYPKQGTGYHTECIGYPAEGVGYSMEGSGYPTQGTGYPAEGSGYPTEGTGYSIQGSGYPTEGYRNPYILPTITVDSKQPMCVVVRKSGYPGNDLDTVFGPEFVRKLSRLHLNLLENE